MHKHICIHTHTHMYIKRSVLVFKHIIPLTTLLTYAPISPPTRPHQTVAYIHIYSHMYPHIHRAHMCMYVVCGVLQCVHTCRGTHTHATDCVSEASRCAWNIRTLMNVVSSSHLLIGRLCASAHPDPLPPLPKLTCWLL